MGDVTILIACGLEREARILAGDGRMIVIGGGDAARLEAMLEAHAARATIVLSCGIAGALDPALKAGDVVIDHKPLPLGNLAANDGLRTALPDARHGTIIGQDHIAATAAEKARLHRETGALAVDMETHIAARVAARHGLALAAIRTISDTASETLPPAALVGMNPDGSMALASVLLSLARQPSQLPALIRTGRNAETAFRALRRVGDALVGLRIGDPDLRKLTLDMR